MVESAPRVHLLTPQAPAGIAVLSLRGVGADRLLKDVFQPSGKLKRGLPAPERAAHGYLLHEGEPIDEVLIICVQDRPPHYEICCHGGSASADAILRTLVDRGAEAFPWPGLSEPGTLEHDLFDALLRCRGIEQAVYLAYLAQGPLRCAFVSLLDALVFSSRGETDRISAAISMAEDLESSFALGRFLYRPARVVICGPANAGKSTLFNAMVGENRALASKIPGTTRDTVESFFLLHGFPVRLFDLPGRIETGEGGPETLARRQAERILLDADLLLNLEALSPENSPGSREGQDRRDRPHDVDELRVLNKTDLLNPAQLEELEKRVQGNRAECILVSARNGSGLDRLFERIGARIGLATLRKRYRALIFNKRQLKMIRRAKSALKSSQADPRLMTIMERYLSASADRSGTWV
jgi:tRNA modification GTPase